MKAGLAVDAEGKLAIGAPPHAALPLHDHGALAGDSRAQNSTLSQREREKKRKKERRSHRARGGGAGAGRGVVFQKRIKL